MYIYSNTEAGLLTVESCEKIHQYRVLDADGKDVLCPVLDCVAIEEGYRTRFDAAALLPWSPDSPTLYTFECPEETVRFGYTTLRTVQNSTVWLNGSPVYLRGYIRGIVAHDHPNMTGGTLYDAACKNIRQAKKYGFNLVRFHSTIPTEEFVRAADELGLLIHMEIGFAYVRDDQGQKKKLSMSNEAWVDALLRFRNHPSVAVFCIGNELHNAGRFSEVKVLYDQGKKLAPNKLILDNSGWGEYDRPTADIYSQHIAYFFPNKRHRDMFINGEYWHNNGGVAAQPLYTETSADSADVQCRREPVPIRPVLSHEALHYIDVPDYDALNAKFDAFAAAVGEEYLRQYGIEKPRYLTELPALIEKKQLRDRMADYQAGSRQWKLMATKVFLERLRLSPLCGYEMLQFSDCLKYENKNGIVDFFDDDKGIDAAWMRQFNADLVLLADIPSETCYDTEPTDIAFYASDFLPQPGVRGTFSVFLDGECLYTGEDFALAGGLQKLVTLHITPKQADAPRQKTLRACFTCPEITVENSWKLWFFPQVRPQTKPVLCVQNPALEAFFENGTPDSHLVMTDALTPQVFEQLAAGKTVILLYEYGAERNTWQFPGALERFKPCIWDRGSNLGGVLCHPLLQQRLAANRYFDLQMQELLEAGSKVNLDDCPFAVEEHVRGIDKPVRDRMKGMQQGIKHFLAEDTLRKFSHLFSVKVGSGNLVVCTFNTQNPTAPAVATVLCTLVDSVGEFDAEKAVAPETLRAWLEDVNSRPLRPEDVMNHFWELDNKLVEDKLFWEEVGVDLRKL